MSKTAVAYCVHDNTGYLAVSLDSMTLAHSTSRTDALRASNVFAFISRLPWHAAPGDWQAAASTAEALGATVVLGDWPTEQAQRQADIDHLLVHPNGYTHAGGIDGATGAITTYGYDANGNLTTVIEPSGGNLTTMQYDKENRLVVSQSATSPAPTLPTLTNAGFETPSLGSGTFAYQYNPTGVGWTFGGDSGVSGNGSGFTHGNPNAPEGSQIGFLQMTGTIAQSFTLSSAAIVQVSFYAAQRDSASDGVAPIPNEQTFTVSIGGTLVGTFTPANGTYGLLTTNAIELAAGTYNLVFTGLNPLGSDNSAFLDEVTIVAGTLVSAYGYDGGGMRRSAQEPSASAPTTFIWDGSDYLGEY